MPQRFGLTYVGADNTEHTPYVVHRALLGSLERFIGILIEHYGGDFPFWLAPVQVRVLPVGEAHREAARRARGAARRPGVRVEVDDRDETVGKRIRDAELEKIPLRGRLRRPGVATKRSPCASAAESSRRSRLRRAASPNLLRCEPAKQGRTRSSPPGRRAPWGFNRVAGRGIGAAACSGFCRFEKEEERAW